jgi:hypothetical protein
MACFPTSQAIVVGGGLGGQGHGEKMLGRLRPWRWESLNFLQSFLGYFGIYPLVMTNIAMV